ncbi:hypothetical protein AX16_006190 [Volvariella volvacea WC 439]|nr:hypothetical protein AX16_006190 [Volvariella volvacea WC 439]
MWYPRITLPIIGSLAFKWQLAVIIPLLFISYRNRIARLSLLTGLFAYYVLGVLISIVTWVASTAWWAFVGIAWLGFYVHYFQIAIEYAVLGYGAMGQVKDGFAMLFGELDKLDRKRSKSTRSKSRKTRRESGSGGGTTTEPEPDDYDEEGGGEQSEPRREERTQPAEYNYEDFGDFSQSRFERANDTMNGL